jgi:hypothetical protein
MTTYQTVTPAYGRDYKSKKDAIADWNAGKDFQCQPQGCYISKREANEAGLAINIRYKKLQHVIALRPGE